MLIVKINLTIVLGLVLLLHLMVGFPTEPTKNDSCGRSNITCLVSRLANVNNCTQDDISLCLFSQLGVNLFFDDQGLTVSNVTTPPESSEQNSSSEDSSVEKKRADHCPAFPAAGEIGLRSLCPWEHVYEHFPSTFPEYIGQANCLRNRKACCEMSADSLFECQPVAVQFVVLQQNEQTGQYDQEKTISITVSCTCALNI